MQGERAPHALRLRRLVRLAGRALVPRASPRDLASAIARPALRDTVIGGATSDEEAVARLEAAAGPGWPSPAEANALRQALDREPAVRRGLRARAEAATRSEFDLLGSGPTTLGPEIDWQLDFKSGHRWDRNQPAATIQIEPGLGFDIKVPWELSRLQHLPPLALAHLDGGDQRFARTFVDHVSRWIAANPVGRGVNWRCTMDVALRAISIAWSWQIFRDSDVAGAAFRARLYDSLLAHGRHIRENLEWKPAGRNNHYLADLVGLVALGALLPGLREAQGWFDLGRSELAREAVEQVLPDGGVWESSLPYHRLTMELLLVARLLGGLAELDPVLRRMASFVRGYLKPDGRAPQIGDNDSGRVLAFTERDDLDHSYLLSIAAAAVDGIATVHPRDAEALFWLGPERYQASVEGSAAGRSSSSALPAFGLYVMRAPGLYAAVRCGAVGGGGRGAHAHNDQLSLELWCERDVFVDPGTYLYTPDPAARNRFRGTRAHNTVCVDGREQVDLDSRELFRLGDAGARATAFEADRFVGEHDGYRRLPGQVLHRREVRLGTGGLVEIVDTLEGSGAHQVEVSFHLAPGLTAQVAGGGARIAGEGWRGALAFEAPDGFAIAVEPGEYSPGYGRSVPIEVIRIRGRAGLPVRLRSTVVAAP